MTPTVTRDPRVKASIEIDRAEAATEYLSDCRQALDEGRYPEVEPWAWARLRRRLGAIAERTRRAA